MKKQRKSGIDTREKLLRAASAVFADKNYRDATIAEICEKAGANIAAINYHFNDKETLYREAWRYALAESIKVYPPDGGVRDDDTPEERLRGQINSLLHRIADEGNKEFLIAQKEFVNPTGLLEEVIRKELQPLHERTEALVGALLGPEALETDIKYCAISIISQCVNPIVAKRQKTTGRDKMTDSPPGIEDIDSFTHHVTRFSLAGIAAIRRERREESKGTKKPKRKTISQDGSKP